MTTATIPFLSRPAVAPSLLAYPVPQATFADARYEVRFVQNATEFDAVLKLRFNVYLVMLDIATLDHRTFHLFFP